MHIYVYIYIYLNLYLYLHPTHSGSSLPGYLQCLWRVIGLRSKGTSTPRHRGPPTTGGPPTTLTLLPQHPAHYVPGLRCSRPQQGGDHMGERLELWDWTRGFQLTIQRFDHLNMLIPPGNNQSNYISFTWPVGRGCFATVKKDNILSKQDLGLNK